MGRWAGLVAIGLLGWAIAGGLSYANPGGLDPVRPRTGGQLYVQRVVMLRVGQWYSSLSPSAFADQWQGNWPQPSHEQWQQLLAREAREMAVRQGQNPLTVLVGDSLYLWLPQEQLPGDRLWLNQSISGETTAHMVRRLTYFAGVRPQAIYVMAGVNDLKNGVDPAVLVSNMELIVQRLRMQHRRSRIVVCSILPTRLPSISPAVVRQVNGQLAIAIPRRGAEFADLQFAFADGQGMLRSDLTTDGLHLNAQGYGLLAAYLGQR